MLAEIAVETQRAIVPAFAHILLLQKMNGKNGRVSAVPAAESERPIFQVGERVNGAAVDVDNLRRPPKIGVAHIDRPTGRASPLSGRQSAKAYVPATTNMRHVLA